MLLTYLTLLALSIAFPIGFLIYDSIRQWRFDRKYK